MAQHYAAHAKSRDHFRASRDPPDASLTPDASAYLTPVVAIPGFSNLDWSSDVAIFHCATMAILRELSLTLAIPRTDRSRGNLQPFSRKSSEKVTHMLAALAMLLDVARAGRARSNPFFCPQPLAQ